MPDGLTMVMLEALKGDAFVLVARRGGKAIGYLFATIEGPDPVWYTGDTHAELGHLSVAGAERGNGVGSALMDAMDEELARRGVEDVEIGVDTGRGRACGARKKTGRPDAAASRRPAPGTRGERAPLRERHRRQPGDAGAGGAGRGARRAPRGARLRHCLLYTSPS